MAHLPQQPHSFAASSSRPSSIVSSSGFIDRSAPNLPVIQSPCCLFSSIFPWVKTNRKFGSKRAATATFVLSALVLFYPFLFLSRLLPTSNQQLPSPILLLSSSLLRLLLPGCCNRLGFVFLPESPIVLSLFSLSMILSGNLCGAVLLFV